MVTRWGKHGALDPRLLERVSVYVFFSAVDKERLEVIREWVRLIWYPSMAIARTSFRRYETRLSRGAVGNFDDNME